MMNLPNTELEKTHEELLSELQKTQQLLKETELRLCEMEFQKIEHNRKHLYFKRKAKDWEEKADYWQDQAHQIEGMLHTVINSKFWKMRDVLLAPLKLFRKSAPVEENIVAVPAESTLERRLPEATDLQQAPALSEWASSFIKAPRIAIQAHVFYVDLIKDICDKLSNCPFAYDLYITTTEQYKTTYILNHLESHCTAQNYYVSVVENRGRDVLPFMQQMQPIIDQYDYFCHIHTKRSLTSDIGNHWRAYLYENLLGNTEQMQKIIFAFENNPKLGVLFPEFPEYIVPYIDWANNKEYAEDLMTKMHLDANVLPDDIIFPAGTMFWARSAAVKNLFDLDLSAVPFPEETGQTDGTYMHAVERLWVAVAEQNGYTYTMTGNIYDVPYVE